MSEHTSIEARALSSWRWSHIYKPESSRRRGLSFFYAPHFIGIAGSDRGSLEIYARVMEVLRKLLYDHVIPDREPRSIGIFDCCFSGACAEISVSNIASSMSYADRTLQRTIATKSIEQLSPETLESPPV